MSSKFHLVVLVIAAVFCGAYSETGGFREFSRYYHNYFRSKLGSSPLRLSSELNIIAHSHAEKLAAENTFESSNNGFGENLWAYRGPLRTLKVDCRDAINNWYTGSTVPGNAVSQVNRDVLLSNTTRAFGIGVGTANDYTVVVANYN
ncbi:unnamed protein product [Allacma fusca]|uniref:SCP domain-containing protein n=1 Tax=Allacma fusca TaxID=39272 RepID=A0A8J2PH33_9HEXA|nr:unnamed protein product [Allacma fusca]